MTKRSLASLVLKLLGVYILTGIAVWWPSTAHLFGSASLSWSWILNVLLLWLLPFTVLWLAPALVLIRFSDRIAGRLVPEEEALGALSAWTEDGVLRVVIMCLGISMVVTVIPQVAEYISILVRHKEVSYPAFMEVQERALVSGGVRLGFELLLGLYLAVHPNQIVRLIRLLRRPGGGDSEPVAPQEHAEVPGETLPQEPSK